MANNKFNEADLAAYAEQVESQKVGDSIQMSEAQAHKQDVVAPTQQVKEDVAVSIKESEQYAEVEHEVRQQPTKQRANGLAQIPMDSLPSRGLFYPEGTRIWIRSATVGDIKTWSSMNEDDTADINEKMQSIIESCCVIAYPQGYQYKARWKDLIDIDRMYLLFAIHDYTFPEGSNDVQLKIDEKSSIILQKENVKFIEFPDKLMKYYNADKRCFSFPVKNTKAFANTGGKMDVYITTIGVGDFLIEYVKRCEARNDNYDRNFLQYASILIPNWRLMTGDDKYYELSRSTMDWSAYEWSLLSKVKDIIVKSAANPTIVYKDNGGVEREAPIYFRDGFKSLFMVGLDIDL
jgi:hypothetical protein